MARPKSGRVWVRCGACGTKRKWSANKLAVGAVACPRCGGKLAEMKYGIPAEPGRRKKPKKPKNPDRRPPVRRKPVVDREIVGYGQRRRVLLGMGYATYGEYLGSPLWKTIRARVLAAKGRSCWVCDDPAAAIHHTSYNGLVMQGLDLSHLFPLCEACHRAVEFDGDRKRTFHEARVLFARLVECRREVHEQE